MPKFNTIPIPVVPVLEAPQVNPYLYSTLPSSPTSSKLVQHVSLTTKQILIDYGPLAPNDSPREKSIKAQHTLRGMFNDWIDINPPFPVLERVNPLPPSRAVHSILIFDSPQGDRMFLTSLVQQPNGLSVVLWDVQGAEQRVCQ